MIGLSLDPGLSGRARLGLLALDGLTVREHSAHLQQEIEAWALQTRTRHGGLRSGELPGVEEARRLYKALGLDPTKTRPSSEALLRRVLKGEPLYRINTLVDALNLASLRFMLPFGLYDLDHLRPPVVLRKGTAGEGYEGIRKGRVGVEGRPVLVDAEGPFGNPTSDSARTSIGLSTRRALVVAYAPAGWADPRLLAVLEGTEELLRRHCGGATLARELVG